MRFNKMSKYEFNDTQRKRMAYARKQKKEQERYPLFADEIAAQQIDVDTEMAQRKTRWSKQEVNDRARRSFDWRRARAKLAGYPIPERVQLRAYWQRCGWPGDPTYLLSMLHMYENHRLDMNPPTVRETEENRVAVKAVIARIQARVAANRAAGLPY